jgi:hypothetical protein
MIQTPMVSTVRNQIISRIGETACDYFWIRAVQKRAKEQQIRNCFGKRDSPSH